MYEVCLDVLKLCRVRTYAKQVPSEEISQLSRPNNRQSQTTNATIEVQRSIFVPCVRMHNACMCRDGSGPVFLAQGEMVMEAARSTRDVARFLNVRPDRVSKMVWLGKIPEPGRSPSGDFLWGEEDIRRACRALLGRSLDDVMAEQRKEATA